jgi:hypothetical protein
MITTTIPILAPLLRARFILDFRDSKGGFGPAVKLYRFCYLFPFTDSKFLSARLGCDWIDFDLLRHWKTVEPSASPITRAIAATSAKRTITELL